MKRALLLAVLVLAVVFATPALAHHKDGHDNGGGRPAHGCDQADEPNNGNPYHSTCDGETSTRGGHVDGSKGAADNKNPKGQAPDGSDHNNGYECDGNNGHPNPAHTGCATPTPPPPPPTCEDTNTCPTPTPTPSPTCTPGQNQNGICGKIIVCKTNCDEVDPKCEDITDKVCGDDSSVHILPVTGVGVKWLVLIGLVLVAIGILISRR